MKRACAAIPLLCLAACAASRGSQSTYGSPVRRAALYVGERELHDGAWEPLEEQTLVGLELSSYDFGAPVGWEVGLLRSEDDDEVLGLDVEVDISELYAGLRASLGAASDWLHPYVGVGLAYLHAEVDVEGLDDENDQSLAAYVHLGATFDVTESFYLGVDLRVLGGSDGELGGVDGTADYEHVALVLGVHF